MSVELRLLNALNDTRKDIKNNEKTPQDRGKEVKSLEDFCCNEFCCNEILGLVLKIPK